MTVEDVDYTYSAADLERRTAMLGRLEGRGIEIGAFHSPLPVPDGVEVMYVDLLTSEAQRRYFPEVPDDAEIVEPFLIAPADDLKGIDTAALNFVLSSHLLEHISDPIAAIREWYRVLQPGGLLFVCLPDRRHTFDRTRVRTPLSHLCLDATEELGVPARDARDLEHYREWSRAVNYLEDPAQVDFWARHLQRIQYPIHFHCWHPEDFRELVDYLREQGATSFEVLDGVVLKNGYEFVYLLRKL